MKKSISIILAILMCFSCFSIISFAETTDSEHITTVPEGYVGIYTKDDLDNIKLDLSGKYILMNDIVFTEEDYAEGGSFYNSGKGWSPIGTGSYPFYGSFDGNGFSIYNLTINNPNANYQGLFGYVTGGTFVDVCLVNASITGGSFVGGICGRFMRFDVVSDCIVSGHIEGVSNVGGICGGIHRIATGPATISLNKCINTAEVTASENVGGICGYLRPYVTQKYNNVIEINQCINIGNISGEYSGGIVGYNERGEYYDNMITNSYNTGSVSGNSSGGIVGYKCSLKNSYSVGISEEGSIAVDSYSFPDCYYLDDVVSNLTYRNGTGKSKDQMIKQTTYEGWDFDTIWTMEGREDYPYPELRDVPLIFPDELNHKHEYSSEITTPATHLTEGVETFTCACGDTYTEAIAKTTEHTYSTIVTEPTCTDRGFTLYFCACNDFYMADYVEANGHSHTTEITTPATHTAEGVMTFTCACGDTYTEAIAKTTEHTYNAVVTAPTCTEKGYTTYTCKCGDSYVADYIDATGHSHTATITTPATHLNEGVMTYTCTCGDTYTEVIAKTKEHTFSEEIITESTCTAKGKKLFTCECGYSYSEEIAKTSHVNANGDYACDICGNNICSHMCHQSGFMGFIWKIINFFQKLFGMNPICECGAYHY